MTDVPNPYDEFPYQSVALVETHPERLATVAAIFGMDTADVRTSRILEIGCAGGGNLIPLATILPDATFVGVDYSPRQIAQAEETAKAVGVTNVTFHAKSVTDLTREFGEFDYIICHGVYSWVTDEVKTAILRVASENLAPIGVAYISFNTFPGWHVPGMIREMMMYHVRDMPDPAGKVKAARAFLEFLGENVADKEGHYGKILREEAQQLRPHADSYVLHEHLEDLNHPIYFHEFARRAADHGLKYLGDSRVWAMAAAAQPPLSATLDRVAKDPITREQYYDFLTNRRFRRTLLCHEQAGASGVASIERVKTLRASAAVWPTTSPTDFVSKVSIDFRAADGLIRLSTTEPLFKAALVILTEAFPRSLGFEELWALTKSKLARSGVEPGANTDLLAARLLQGFGANAVELHTFEPPLPVEPSDTPEALPMARIVAETSQSVPNYRHRQATISEFDRLVIRQLDGTHTRAEIVERLIQAVLDGQFTIQENALPVRDPERLRPILERSLPPSLQRLNRNALLMR